MENRYTKPGSQSGGGPRYCKKCGNKKSKCGCN